MPDAPISERTERDLRQQVSGLGGLEKEVLFQHIRTGQELVTIYAMSDGEPIPMPMHAARAAMQKKNEKGWMFTDNESEAPTYVRGTVRCFLHAESVERAAGVLAEIGLSGKTCPAGSLVSDYAKESHAQHKHRQEYAAWQKYLENKEKREDREATRQQLDATLAIAGKAADGVPATKAEVALQECPVADCDYMGTEPQVRGHKMGAHK